jgi:hypothetical protein
MLAKQTKMESCPDRGGVQQDFLLYLLQVSQCNLCEKKYLKRNKNVVGLEMYTADWRKTCKVGERENK